jgi:hypothetical protein
MPPGTSTTTSTTFQRGAALTAVLVVATLSEALVLTLLLSAWNQAIAQEQPPTVFLPLSVVGAALTLVAYAGLWTGHRWAFWLFVAMAVLALTIKATVGAPVPLIALQAALQLLLAVVVLRRWSCFS